MHRAGKGFLGFKKVNTNNLTTGFRTVSETQLNTSFYAVAPYKESTYLASNNSLIRETTLQNAWDDRGNKRFWYKVISSSDNQALESRYSNVTNDYDNYGNITGNTVSNNVETISTTTQYGTFVTNIPNRPTFVTVTKNRNGQDSYQTQTQLQYTDKGQLSSKTDFNGQAKSVTTSYSYHGLGYVNNTTVSPAGMSQRSSSANYDGKGRYPENTTNPLGQIAYASYDNRWGKPLTETGIDGLTTSYEYDAFGRTTKTNLPEGYSIQQSYGWDFSEGALYYTQLQHPGKPDVKSWVDVLGREIRKQTEGMNGQGITQKQTYDSRGNVSSSTQPYLPSETVLTTTSSFDEYNRPTSSGNGAFGTSTVNYSYSNGNLTVTTTNPAGQQSSKITDASGQVITASDNGGTLNYTYYSHGGLREVKKDGNTIASHEYDAYGRQTRLTDANAGSTTYDYDALGQLVTQTNANSQTHTMQYDVLGRNTSRNGPEGTTTTEYYGSQGSSTNQLRKVTGFAANTTEYTYDEKGRVQTIKQTLDGSEYTTSMGYNTYGDVTSKNYSTGFGTNQYYDGNGYLTSIKNNSNSVTLYTTGSLNGLGQVKSYNLGNGKSSQVDDYYGTPTRYYTDNVQDLNLGWNYQSGNLNYRQDGRKNKKENFSYDNLNRLTSFQVEGQSSISMNYASSGNIDSKTDAGTYSYLGSKPNAVEYVNNPQGVISGQQQQISYTAFMQPQVITENNYELTYTYGADYDRYKGVLKQNGNTLWTRYYLGDFERNNNQYIHYIQSPAGLVAMVVRENGNDTYYYTYTDHLGSILTVTDGSGNVVTEQNFDPWGRRRHPGNWDYTNVPNSPSWLYRGYTGHEMLDPFVLINMNGRIYDPVVGRVLSPDNLIADPFDTQAFNRYSYGYNNPLKYSDPDGNLPIFLLPVLAAVIGGGINVAIHAGQIHSFQDGLAAFGIGAAAGVAAFYTGGAAVAAFGLEAASIAGGAVAGIAAGAVDNIVQSVGNLVYFGDAISPKSFLTSVAIGGILGAVGGGIAALSKNPNANLLTGAPRANGAGAFSFNNGRLLTEQGWQRVGGKWWNPLGGGGNVTFESAELANGQVVDHLGGLNSGDVRYYGMEFLDDNARMLEQPFVNTLTGTVRSNYARFFSKIPANSKSNAAWKLLGDGNYLFEASSPGKVPGSSALYQKWVNPFGETFKMLKTTFGPDGNIIHIKPKF